MGRARWTNRIAQYYPAHDDGRASPVYRAASREHAFGDYGSRFRTVRRVVASGNADQHDRTASVRALGLVAGLLATIACSVVAVIGLAEFAGGTAVAARAPAILLLGVAGAACALVAVYCAALSSPPGE